MVILGEVSFPNHLDFGGSTPGGGGSGHGARGKISLSDLSRVGVSQGPAIDVPAILDQRFIVLGGVSTEHAVALGVHSE